MGSDSAEADQSAASALLTAQSIVIAAFAIAFQNHDLIAATAGIAYIQSIGFFAVALTLVSFSSSLAYLHTAQYPDGIVATLSPRSYFNITLISFLCLIYLVLLLVPVMML